MHVREKEKDGVMICYISGEVTIDTVTELKKIFKSIIENKWQKTIFNLKDMEYIDSSGLASFVEFSIDLKAIRGEISLSNLPPKILSIFGITKLEKMFKIAETEEEALKGFGAQPRI